MKIEDKQTLWTKYYLSKTSQKDDFFALFSFVINEVGEPEKLEGNNFKVLSMKKEKIRKTLKCMLKYLPKKEILKRYLNFRRSSYHEFTKSKLIDYIIKRF